MALTNQQVQQAYLSVLGRPAEGDAVLWGSLATDVPGLINTIITIRNGVDFNKDNTIFVQNLYENLLGRTGDDEGLSFWVAALNAGMNHGELVTSFISSAAQTLNDLYTIQNKLALAEQISTQIKTIKGGAPAEAKLKALMNTIDDKTSINDIQEDINHFIGQFNEAKKVTVKPGADEPTIGSDEHASTYNATVNLNDEKTNLNIEGSTSFDDTLNLTVKGSSSNNTFNSSDIGQLSNLNTINLNLRDSRLTNSNITTSDLGAQNLKIKGTSADNITVNSQMSLLDTGDGGDTLSVNKSVESIKTGKGNDKVTINAKVGTLDTSAGNDNIKVNAQVNSIDAGSGNDIIDLAAGSKINKLNAGAGDDIISISQKANIKNALIDGGAGFNSLKLYDGLVDLTNTTLSGINALSGEARLKLSQIGAQNFILGVERLDNFAEPTGIFDTAKLEIKAEQGSMDLSKLAIAEDSTGHELKILDVKNSTIKLNDNNLGNSDGSDSTKVSVYGTDGNDTITIESGKVSLLDSLKGNDTITISQAASVAILNANDGKNKITIAGKVGTLTTKSGDDNISVSGEASTINTNDGNDIINISGQANRLDTGAGNDNISLSGTLKELNAGSGNDTININQGARIRDLKAGDGDDTINIQKGADINNAKIDGGSGFNSLKLSNGEVDLSKTSLNNISAISGEAKLSANQVNNKSLTLGTGQKDNYGDPSGVFDSATLNIQADKADLNLQGLKIASGSKNHTINIQNAKESQISLNDKNLGNDGIDDVEVFASKVNVAGTANKDKITLKEGKFASLDANNGNDIINIEKGASLASLKAGDGNDTINIKGKVSELDAGNGDDDVIVEKDAEVKKLNAGAGDDIIRVKNGAKIDLIDGNAGSDTLAFDKSSGGTSQATDISKTTISNIEILDGEGVLSAKQINGQSFILGGDKDKEVDGQKLLGNAKLQVKSDDLTNINLNNLKSQTGVKDNTIELQDVSEGKITLSDAKQYIKETIKLTANAHSVDISNIKGGDKIDFENIQKLNGSTGTNNAAHSPEALDNTKNTTISGSKLYTINLVNGSVDDLSSLDSTLSTYSVASNANALLAINQNGKAHIFKVNGPSTQSSLNSNMLKLLAITDSEINLGTTKVIGNTIEINGSVTITINKEDKIVQSAGNADTVFVGSVDISQADQGTPNKDTQIIGSKDFTDTLAIQITSGASTGGTGTNKLDQTNFNKIVDTNKVKDVENLTLSTGNVEVDLTLENTNGNFQNEVTIAGSGKTKLQVKQDTQKISLGSGSGDVTVSSASVGDLNLGGGQNTLKVENSGKIGEVTGSDGQDTITISSSGSVDKITTNGGADTITLSGNGTLKTLEASKGNDEVTISGSGSISNITGEGKVKIGDQTTLNNTLDIGSYKAELTISGGSANVKNLLADNNQIKLEANSQIEKLQIKDGGNVSVSGSGSITFDTTNDAGTHTLTVGQDTTLKTFTAGSGDDTITIANGGKLSGDKLALTNGDNTLNIASGGNVASLTTITTGNGTNKITIDKNATASSLATINLGNGTNTLDLSVSGATNGLTVSGGNGTDNINLSGTNGKIATLNAGANSTNISLKANDNTITTINANDKGSTINIASGSGTITTIEGKSGLDSISVGKGNTVNEIKTGTGAISIDGEGTITKVTVSQNASGDISIGNGTKTTVTTLQAGNNGTSNQNINLANGSTISTLEAKSGGAITLNGNGEVTTLDLSGATTENITIANGASVKNFTTDQQGNDNITVANGGKLDVTDTSKTLNFSGGNDKLEVQSGGDISTITIITMGDGSGSVTLKDGAKADKLATINLGNGDNNLDLGISGATQGITVSGGSGTDTIKVSGAGKITTLNAGANKTDITLENGGSISTINANNNASSTIEVSGSGHIKEIKGNTKDDTITLGKDITVDNIDTGANQTTTINGGNITTLKTTSVGNVVVTVDKQAHITTLNTSNSNGAVTISGASTVDSLTAAGAVTISGASTVNSLTTTSSGAITISGTGTTLKNDLNGKSGANNKITIADGAKVDGTINLNAAQDDNRGASTSGDVVNISGANTVVNKIDTGSGVKTITLENNATINTIDAGYKKNDILLSGSGTVKELITGDTAPGGTDKHVIQIGGNDASKKVEVSTFTAGTGTDEITVASGGKISNEVINLNNGDNKFSVSGDISGANKILTGSGKNTITLSDGAKLKDNLMVDFSNAGDTKTSTLAMNASGSISVTASKNTTISVSGANTGADPKAKIDTLKAGAGTTTINFTNNAKIKTINANEQADSTITVSGSGSITTLNGSDTKDTIKINDANSSITNLNAGAGSTDVTFSAGATVTNLSVSKSGSEINIRNTSTSDATITKLSTATGTGTHKIDVDNKVKIAGFDAGNGDDSITVKSGGTISASSLDFKSGANTLDLKSGANISSLTNLKMGDGGNANLTIENGVTLGTNNLSIELGSAGTGATDKNTFTLKASGDIITLSGSSSLDEITVAGNNAKLGTLNAGTGTTQITLNDNATITTINAKDTEGSTINISGSGSITTIVGKSGADTINLSQHITVTTYTGGTGDDNINLSGATITTLDTNTGKTTISGDTTNKGTVSTLKTTSGGSHTITVSNATINKYEAGTQNDTLIVSNGGAIGDSTNKELNLGSGSNTLTVQSGGNISNLSTITMGDGGNANITIEKGATLSTTTQTINLGTAGSGQDAKNTFKLYTSGDNLSLSGSSSLDEITVSGNGINLNKLSAGSGTTTINLESNGGIKTLELGDQANTISINGSGGVSTITASGSVAHTLTVGDKATISSYSGGSGADTITIGSGANINVTSSSPSTQLNITTGSGDDTITIEKGAKFASGVTIDFTASGSGTLKLKGNDFDLTKMDPIQGTTKNALSVKNVTKIDLTEATGNINFGGNSGATITKTNNGEVEITGVKSKDSTITLSDKAHEKVTLESGAKGITILSVTSGDKIDFHNVANDLSTAISSGTFSSVGSTGTNTTISSSGAYVWNDGIEGFDKQDQVKTQIQTAASSLTTGQKALVAVKNNDQSKSAIYLVSGSGTGNNDITLDLLGIVGNKIDNNDKLASGGVIEFA